MGKGWCEGHVVLLRDWVPSDQSFQTAINPRAVQEAQRQRRWQPGPRAAETL
jgi:hypothetical protein